MKCYLCGYETQSMGYFHMHRYECEHERIENEKLYQEWKEHADKCEKEAFEAMEEEEKQTGDDS